MTAEKLYQQMHNDWQQKQIFDKANKYGQQYLDTVEQRNVFPTQDAINNLAAFDEAMPALGSTADHVLDLLHQYGAPATVTTTGGRYFGFVTGSAVPAGMAAKQLSSFWDQCSAMYVMSPLASRLETIVERWLVDLFGLPEKTVAGFVSGTSMANFSALAAARYRVLKNAGWDVNMQGLFGAPRIRIVTGRQAHSTVVKAIGLLGFGKDNVEWVDVDDQGRIIPEAMPVLDDRTILILQAGNVNTGSFDPFEKIMAKAKAANCWVHIDGAFGLWAQAVESLNYLTKGIEEATSWAVDGHKTLNTPYDCGIVMCADKEALVSALQMSGSYIVASEQRDGMLYTPEMSRRSRVIELWATIKFLGKNGIDTMIKNMVDHAKAFRDELSQLAGYTVLNEVVFNQVLVRCETDDLTEKTMKRIQDLRECWVGGSVWDGKKAIRISVCSWATTRDDIKRSANSFAKALKEIKTAVH